MLCGIPRRCRACAVELGGGGGGGGAVWGAGACCRAFGQTLANSCSQHPWTRSGLCTLRRLGWHFAWLLPLLTVHTSPAQETSDVCPCATLLAANPSPLITALRRPRRLVPPPLAVLPPDPPPPLPRASLLPSRWASPRRSWTAWWASTPAARRRWVVVRLKETDTGGAQAASCFCLELVSNITPVTFDTSTLLNARVLPLTHAVGHHAHADYISTPMSVIASLSR